MAVLSKRHNLPLYNLNYFIINFPIFQYIHKFFTVCSHFVHFLSCFSPGPFSAALQRGIFLVFRAALLLSFPLLPDRSQPCRALCLLWFPLSASFYLHNSIYYCKPSRLHKKYVLFSTHPHYPQSFSRKCAKVMHINFCPFYRKKQLYTNLSTLSTFFLCLSPVFSRQGNLRLFLYTSHKFSFFDKKYTILPWQTFPPTVVCQPGFNEKKDTQVLSFSVFAHHPSHIPKNAPHFFTDVQIKTF